MTDIIERLRKADAWLRHGHVDASITDSDGPLLLDAACEIERLRDAIERLFRAAMVDRSKANAEIKRLRQTSQYQ